ncbi:hypothetical protein HMPREF0004_1962 [Achromobacter piechaudii ATCC 43553]|uniref:Uncharacterized protein n=1 Tax=Achromobacter piechaudii ATCC 43553 TaxID=742159 RepID=D4X915_9BURK|nr:hypothetical protein HMPREF0004_1962 [Achromobacter piechaudii ATCC 43553]
MINCKVSTRICCNALRFEKGFPALHAVYCRPADNCPFRTAKPM